MTRRSKPGESQSPTETTSQDVVETPTKSEDDKVARPRSVTHYRCSFCNKGQEEVRRLIAGPNRVYICDECVQLCREIIEEEEPAKAVIQDARRRAQQNVESLKTTQRLLSAAQTLLEPASMNDGFVSDELRKQLETQCVQAIQKAGASFGLKLVPVEDATPTADEAGSQNGIDDTTE